MTWIVWRQHRSAIALTTVLAIAIAILAIALRGGTLNSADWVLDLDSYLPVESLVPYGPRALGAAVAVFWAAPLISREYETRTNIVAWGQDVSPLRWLMGKVALLGAVAVGLSAIVGAITGSWRDVYTAGNLRNGVFEVNPYLQASSTLFGFALGLAFSALFRRTLPAMGATLLVFLAARGVVAGYVREHFIPPMRWFREWNPPADVSAQELSTGAWTVDHGYADASGTPVSISPADSDQCMSTGSTAAQTECLKGKGASGIYADYHPHDRLVWLYVVEIGTFTLLAVVLFALVFRWITKASGKSFRRPLTPQYTVDEPRDE